MPESPLTRETAPITTPAASSDAVSFDNFVADHGRRLWQALVPLVGPDAAHDAVADALAEAWSAWPRVRLMDNPVGYVFVIARRRARRMAPTGDLPIGLAEPQSVPGGETNAYEPGLQAALEQLSEMQRQVVVIVVGFGWGLTEVADHLGISVSTVRTHLARGMNQLRFLLKVDLDD